MGRKYHALRGCLLSLCSIANLLGFGLVLVAGGDISIVRLNLRRHDAYPLVSSCLLKMLLHGKEVEVRGVSLALTVYDVFAFSLLAVRRTGIVIISRTKLV